MGGLVVHQTLILSTHPPPIARARIKATPPGPQTRVQISAHWKIDWIAGPINRPPPQRVGKDGPPTAQDGHLFGGGGYPSAAN